MRRPSCQGADLHLTVSPLSCYAWLLVLLTIAPHYAHPLRAFAERQDCSGDFGVHVSFLIRLQLAECREGDVCRGRNIGAGGEKAVVDTMRRLANTVGKDSKLSTRGTLVDGELRSAQGPGSAPPVWFVFTGNLMHVYQPHAIY